MEEPDLTVRPVVVEGPLSLMVSDSHPLAAYGRVRLEDLGECVLPAFPEAAPRYWVEAVEPFHTPSGQPVARGPVVRTFQEIQGFVISEGLTCVVHAAGPRHYQRPASCTFRSRTPSPAGGCS